MYFTKLNLLLFVVFSMVFGESLPKVQKLLEKIDYDNSLSTDLTGRIEVIQKQVDQAARKLEMIYYRRDVSDSFLIVMLSPNVEKGNGYLKVADNFWSYRKNTRNFQHINRDESIAGTDLNSGDLEQRKYSELYSGVISNGQEICSVDYLGKIACYRFLLNSKEDDVTYPIQEIWVKKTNGAILRIESYSSSGKHMQSQYFTKYTKIKNKLFVLEGRSIDRFEKGNGTKFKIIDIGINEIDDSVFTKGYLESLSR